MERQKNIELLEQLKNGQITLDEFKRKSNHNNLPILVLWESDNQYSYNGKMYTREELTAKYESIIFLEPASELLNSGKTLRQILK